MIKGPLEHVRILWVSDRPRARKSFLDILSSQNIRVPFDSISLEKRIVDPTEKLAEYKRREVVKSREI